MNQIPEFTCKYTETTSVRWTSVYLFGPHPRCRPAFTPTQTDINQGVNTPEFNSTGQNKVGVNATLDSQVSLDTLIDSGQFPRFHC